MQQSSTPTLRTARMICGALMGGVVAFWSVVLILNAGGTFVQGLTIDPRAVLAIAIAVAVGAFAVALLFRSRALAAASGAPRSDTAASGPDAGRVQSNLIVAWALLEGQAMVAGVLFLLTGAASVLIVSALVFVIGFALTFPREAWFSPAGRTSAAQP